MKVDGEDIIITDPCYIASDDDWGESFNYENPSIDDPNFTDYLLDSTGVGDGSWTAYQTNKKESLVRLTKLIDSVYEKDDYSDIVIGDKVGEYAADAGLSCVLLVKEVKAYDPDLDLEQLISSGCAVVIKNFTGNIDTYFDNSDMLHFIGIGNKSFYTV